MIIISYGLLLWGNCRRSERLPIAQCLKYQFGVCNLSPPLLQMCVRWLWQNTHTNNGGRCWLRETSNPRCSALNCPLTNIIKRRPIFIKSLSQTQLFHLQLDIWPDTCFCQGFSTNLVIFVTYVSTHLLPTLLLTNFV